jgi:hypothetical protein
VTKSAKFRGWSETVKNIAETLALLAAGGWAIWTFHYTFFVVPSSVPPHLTLGSNLELVGRSANFFTVKARVRVHNDSSTRVHVVSSIFNMHAYRVSAKAKALLPSDGTRLVQGDTDFVELPEFVEKDKGEVVDSGRLFPNNGWWLDAGEEQNVEFITLVPSYYDLVEIRSDFRISRDRCNNLLVSRKVNLDGSVSVDLSVLRNGQAEEYDHDRHHDFLAGSTPFRVYTTSSLSLQSRRLPLVLQGAPVQARGPSPSSRGTLAARRHIHGSSAVGP